MPWLRALRVYLAVTAAGNLLWETAQLPLYTIWQSGNPREIAFAVLHCTGGDLVIAAGALVTALALAGRRGWPFQAFPPVAVLTLTFGMTYTVYSEWLNTTVRMTWAYSKLMPIVPILHVGLSPFLQWIAIPTAALTIAQRHHGAARRGCISID